MVSEERIVSPIVSEESKVSEERIVSPVVSEENKVSPLKYHLKNKSRRTLRHVNSLYQDLLSSFELYENEHNKLYRKEVLDICDVLCDKKNLLNVKQLLKILKILTYLCLDSSDSNIVEIIEEIDTRTFDDVEDIIFYVRL